MVETSVYHPYLQPPQRAQPGSLLPHQCSHHRLPLGQHSAQSRLWAPYKGRNGALKVTGLTLAAQRVQH